MPRLVLITGVSRGLGRAMAEGFIARGHRVRGCGRDPEAIAELNRIHAPDLPLNNAAVINRNAPLS